MIPMEKRNSVRIFDFERVFICEVPTDHPDSIRLNGILKAMDALMLFNNSFFHKNNFNPCDASQYERSVKIYEMMKNYIFELMPRKNNCFIYPTNNNNRHGEQLDTKILRFFQKWHPNAANPINEASTMKDLNGKLAALYQENVVLSEGERKTFLQYTTFFKGDRL